MKVAIWLSLNTALMKNLNTIMISITRSELNIDDWFLKATEKEAWKNQAPYSLLTIAERTEHQESAEPHG